MFLLHLDIENTVNDYTLFNICIIYSCRRSSILCVFVRKPPRSWTWPGFGVSDSSYKCREPLQSSQWRFHSARPRSICLYLDNRVSENGYIYTQIFVNSDVVGAMYTSSYGVNNARTTTAIVVKHLDTMDVVSIRVNMHGALSGYIWSNEYHKSSFSGWKIF